jgi:hypothetical protein
MNLGQRVSSELRRTSQETSETPKTFTFAMEGVSVHVSVDDCDRLAVSLVHLAIAASSLGSCEDEEDFAGRCHHLVSKVNYLQEPLKIIEMDGTELIAVIRSYPPRVENPSVCYWEVKHNGKKGTISLSRKENGINSGQETNVGMVLGYEILCRLINDLSEVFTESAKVSTHRLGHAAPHEIDAAASAVSVT